MLEQQHEHMGMLNEICEEAEKTSSCWKSVPVGVRNVLLAAIYALPDYKARKDASEMMISFAKLLLKHKTKRTDSTVLFPF